jgi:hypothetical protein
MFIVDKAEIEAGFALAEKEGIIDRYIKYMFPNGLPEKSAIVFDKVVSAIVGVFWFNEDFTDLKIDGKAIFDKNDLEKKVFRNPACNHASLDTGFLNRKRGRVFIEGGKVFICVGKNCPIYDPVEYDSEKSPKIGTNLVIDKFNLEHFTDVIEIIQDLHWNGDGKSYKIDDKYLA